jgi:leucyl-tRNA synthetase
MFNVVNPDTIIEKYGADTLRIYEMFLGPLEQSKPWDTNGIDGCHRFIRKMWNLFFDNRNGELIVTDETPSKDELKSIHKVIKKVSEDVENFSYNTSVSAFLICVNELTSLKSHNKQVLDILVRLAAPFMPHIAEELWHTLGHNDSVCNSEWPVCNEEYLKEDSITYSISFNGKTRFTMDFPAEATAQEIQDAVLSNEKAISYIDGKAIRKVIVVPKKIVNVVI